MLNILWASMILAGILYGTFTGNLEAITGGALDSTAEAISLCITMAGVMALWMGMLEIGQQSGLMEKMTSGIQPLLHFLFPKIPKNHPSLPYISANIVANVLGLGWACTPAGLKAMEELAKLEKERGTPGYEESQEEEKGSLKKDIPCLRERRASNEMCTFLILNISSLQLIPVNMIAYRSQYGSTNPAKITAPALVATLVSTLAAVLFCKIKDRH